MGKMGDSSDAPSALRVENSQAVPRFLQPCQVSRREKEFNVNYMKTRIELSAVVNKD